MTPTPSYRRCGHLASGPDGFPCPHPTCWTGGVLQVVPLPSGPEEFWERLLYVPRGAPMFFGWRIIGEVTQAVAPSEEARTVAPAVVSAPTPSVAPVVVSETPGAPVEPKPKKRGMR